MAPITAATFAHTLDTAVKQTAGYNLATYFDLTDSHARGLLDGLPMREQKTVELVRLPSYARVRVSCGCSRKLTRSLSHNSTSSLTAGHTPSV